MTAATSRPDVTLELPPGARRLGPRVVARRLGVTVETADRLLSEGRLIAYTEAGSPQIHISPVERFEVARS